jgi:protein tyrosine/serine phosphatase
MNKKQFLTQFLILVTFWSYAPSSPGKAPAKAVPTQQEGIVNFHMVHPFLYRSGEFAPPQLKTLVGLGIKTIIDLRAAGERTREEAKQARALGLNYQNLPMSSKAPTQSQVNSFLALVDQARQENAPALVHCAHGSDRTGCLVGIWRVSRDGYTYKEAYKEMRRYYFGPQFTHLARAVKTRARAQETKP